jgi:hypothetical protein
MSKMKTKGELLVSGNTLRLGSLEKVDPLLQLRKLG